MNKYQEALDFIERNSCPQKKACNECDFRRFCNSIAKEKLDVLQELVDKTAPKKMMNVTSHDDHEFGDYVYSTGYCPICNKIFYFDALVDVINYCPNCGQKLSWDGKHERVGVA